MQIPSQRIQWRNQNEASLVWGFGEDWPGPAKFFRLSSLCSMFTLATPLNITSGFLFNLIPSMFFSARSSNDYFWKMFFNRYIYCNKLYQMNYILCSAITSHMRLKVEISIPGGGNPVGVKRSTLPHIFVVGVHCVRKHKFFLFEQVSLHENALKMFATSHGNTVTKLSLRLEKWNIFWVYFCSDSNLRRTVSTQILCQNNPMCVPLYSKLHVLFALWIRTQVDLSALVRVFHVTTLYKLSFLFINLHHTTEANG